MIESQATEMETRFASLLASEVLGSEGIAEWWARLAPHEWGGPRGAPATVEDLLTRLGTGPTGNVLQRLSANHLPLSREQNSLGWTGSVEQCLRKNLGVWYSTLLLVGHYVHRYNSASVTDAVEKRMLGIAREALRWLPGSFLTHVATYFAEYDRGTAMQPTRLGEQSELVTCSGFLAGSGINPFVDHRRTLDAFQRRFQEYVNEHGSTIRSDPQVLQLTLPPRRESAASAPLADGPVAYCSAPLQPLVLPPGEHRGDRTAYLEVVIEYLGSLGLSVSLDQLDLLQLSSGSDSAALQPSIAREASAHLYVVQLRRDGFNEYSSQKYSDATYGYQSAFRENLGRLALENALSKWAALERQRSGRSMKTLRTVFAIGHELTTYGVSIGAANLQEHFRRLRGNTPIPDSLRLETIRKLGLMQLQTAFVSLLRVLQKSEASDEQKRALLEQIYRTQDLASREERDLLCDYTNTVSALLGFVASLTPNSNTVRILGTGTTLLESALSPFSLAELYAKGARPSTAGFDLRKVDFPPFRLDNDDSQGVAAALLSLIAEPARNAAIGLAGVPEEQRLLAWCLLWDHSAREILVQIANMATTTLQTEPNSISYINHMGALLDIGKVSIDSPITTADGYSLSCVTIRLRPAHLCLDTIFPAR